MGDFNNKGSFGYGGCAWVPQTKYVATGDATAGIAITDVGPTYQNLPHVTDILISVSGAANTFTISDTVGGSTELKVYMAANSQFVYSPRSEIILPTGETLTLRAFSAGNVAVRTSTYFV